MAGVFNAARLLCIKRYVHDRISLARSGGIGGIGGIERGVAHAHAIDPVNRDLVIDHQIPDYCVGHILRPFNSNLSPSVGVALNLDDVTLLSGQLLGNLIERRFRLVIQSRLGAAEMEFGIGDLRILIEIGDSGSQLSGLGAGLLRRLLRLTGLCRGLARLLVGLIRG